MLKPPSKQCRTKVDEFSRRLPHFVFSRQDQTILAMDRHGKTSLPNHQTGHIPNIIKQTLLQHESTMSFFEMAHTSKHFLDTETNLRFMILSKCNGRTLFILPKLSVFTSDQYWTQSRLATPAICLPWFMLLMKNRQAKSVDTQTHFCRLIIT